MSEKIYWEMAEWLKIMDMAESTYHSMDEYIKPKSIKVSRKRMILESPEKWISRMVEREKFISANGVPQFNTHLRNTPCYFCKRKEHDLNKKEYVEFKTYPFGDVPTCTRCWSKYAVPRSTHSLKYPDDATFATKWLANKIDETVRENSSLS